MKHLKLFFAIAIAVTMAACGGKTKQLEAQRDSLLLAQQAQQEIINDMYGTLGEVSLTLDSIAANDGLLQFRSAEGKLLTKDQIRANLNSYKQLLADSKAKIADLQGKLQGNAKELERLNGIIKFLENELAKKDAAIDELMKELESKNANIAQLSMHVETLSVANDSLSKGLEETKKDLDNAIKQKDAVYFLVANKSVLKSMNLYNSGNIAKKHSLNFKNLSPDGFTKSSSTELTSVAINGKNPEIMTGQPESSYELQMASKTQYTLKITNPAAFWANTKFLVIKVD